MRLVLVLLVESGASTEDIALERQRFLSALRESATDDPQPCATPSLARSLPALPEAQAQLAGVPSALAPQSPVRTPADNAKTPVHTRPDSGLYLESTDTASLPRSPPSGAEGPQNIQMVSPVVSVSHNRKSWPLM